MQNQTFDFKSHNINIDTSVFDTDFNENNFKSPFRQNKANRGALYARHLASRARGSSLKVKDKNINCLNNFIKDQMSVMNDSQSVDKQSLNNTQKSMISSKSCKYNNQLIAKAEKEIKQRRSEINSYEKEGPISYAGLMHAYNDE
jgi:hypothetical protein